MGYAAKTPATPKLSEPNKPSVLHWALVQANVYKYSYS